MKQILNAVRWPAAGLFLTVMLFAACKKDENPGNIRTPAAGLMVFNLSPDKPAVGLSLSGSNLNLGVTGLGYNNFSGSYLPIYTGTRELRSFDYSTGSTIAISNGVFADSAYYSAFVLGANGNYQNVVVRDELDSLTAASGKAWVRYINAIPDSTGSPTVTITANGENVFNETASYGNLSSFNRVNAGTVSTSVSNEGSISASRNITLEENKIYTVLLTGLPGVTDSSKAVQIKFIQNGTITP